MLSSLAALACCNSIVGFDELIRVQDDDAGASSSSGKPGSSSSSSSGTSTEGGPTARCDPTKDFAAATIIPELDGTVSTKTAIMTPDELEIFYLRGDSAPFDFRHAVRESRDDAWGEPTTEVLDPDATELGSFAVNGLKLYYWHVESGPSTLTSEPVAATRSALKAAFSPGTTLVGDTDRQLYVNDNDNAGYWATYFVPDGGVAEEAILRGQITGNRIVNGAVVDALHITGVLDEHPSLMGNQELTIYFASNRLPTFGAEDIWRATRNSPQEEYGPPIHVDGVSSSDPDWPSWVSSDDCVMLLQRLKHFYIAQRPL